MNKIFVVLVIIAIILCNLEKDIRVNMPVVPEHPIDVEIVNGDTIDTTQLSNTTDIMKFPEFACPVIDTCIMPIKDTIHYDKISVDSIIIEETNYDFTVIIYKK